MTDKERLEEIRAEVEQMAYTSPLNFEKTRINKESALWLMEKLEELELEINDWRAEVRKWQRFYKESEESHSETKELLKSIVNQNKCYREALEFYADEEHYKEKLISEAQYDADGVYISNDVYAPPIIYLDKGETARKALEENHG